MAELADSLEATEDDRLYQAEAAVRAYCGWHIAPSRTESHTFQTNRAHPYDAHDWRDGRDWREQRPAPLVVLPSLYVTAVSAVSVGSEVLPTDAYRWAENGVVTLYCGSPWAPVTVTFTHGYIDAPDVTGVVQALARRSLRDSGVTSKTTGPFSETYATDGFLTPGELAILNRYKLPRLP